MPRDGDGLRRITVGIDGSTEGQQALRLAIRLAAAARAHLRIVAVSPTMPAFARHPQEAAPLVARLERDAQEALDAALGAAADARLHATGGRLAGYPAEAIHADLQAHPADLLVLGPRGLSAQRMHLLGSTTYNLAQAAPCPVLVARSAAPEGRVLLCADGSDAARAAADLGARFAAALGVGCVLLYVIPQGIDEVKWTLSRSMARPFIAPLEERLKGNGLAVETRVEYGRPAETILRVAGEDRCGLVAIGRTGRAGAVGFTLGGVADRLLHLAKESLLLV